MKKFFKALALVLALTLVIGTVPASAATEYSLKWKEKKIYLGEKMGWKYDTDGTTKVYYNGLNKVSYAKAIVGIASKDEATELEVTAKSSNEEVVSTHNKAKKIVAESIGDATVTYYVGEKEIGSIKYIVKKTAADVIRFGAGDDRLHEDGSKVVLNKEYYVSLPWTTDGEKVDTNKRRLYVTDKDGKEVSADVAVVTAVADAARLWTVKFLKEGDYVIVGEAYQSNTYNGTTGSVSMNVTAAQAAPTKAVQTGAAEVTVYFDDDASTYEAKDFSIYYLNAADVKITDKVVKSATYNKDANTVTVVIYSDFIKGTEYHVVVPSGEVTFKAKSNTVADVDHFVINESQAVVGAFQDITFTYYDAEGMKLSINPGTVLEKVSATADTAVVGSSNVYLAKAGDSIVVKGVYYTIDENYNSVPHYSAEKTIVGINATSGVSPVAYTITDSASGLGIKEKLSDFTINHEFMKGDNAYVHVIVTYTDNTTGKVYYADAASKGVTFTYSSANETVLVASTVTNTGYLNPIANEGNATIVVKDADGGVVYAGEVTMKAARYFAKYEASVSKTSYNSANASDSVTLTITAYDQYDKAWPNAVSYSVVLDTDASSAKITGLTATESGSDLSKGITKYTVKFTNAGDANTVYTGVIKVTAQQNGGSWATIVKKLGVSVDKITDAADNFKWTASATSFDLAVARKSKDANVSGAAITVQLDAYKNAYITGTKAATYVAEAPKTAVLTAAAAEEYVYTVLKDGKTFTPNAKYITVANTGLVTITPYNVSGSAISKMDKGTYTITAYKKAAGAVGDTQVVTPLNTVTVSISDSQISPELVRKNTDTLSEKYNAGNLSAADALAVAQKYFTPKFDGAELSAASIIAATGKVDQSGAVVITSATIRVNVSTDGNTAGNSDVYIDLSAKGTPVVIY
jgi:hypothetical protein